VCGGVQYDQDIVDLLTSLKAESVTSEGGMYAEAMPPPQQAKPEAVDPLSRLMGSAANGIEVSSMYVLISNNHCQ